MGINWEINTDRAAFHLTKQILFLIMGFCSLIIIVALTADYYFEHPQIIQFSVLIEIIILIFILVINKNFRKFHLIPSVGLNSVIIGLYLSVVTWSVFSLITIEIYGSTISGMMVILSSFCFASCFVLFFSDNYSTGRNCILLMILPILLWAFGFQEKESYILMAMTLFYFSLLIRALRGNYGQSQHNMLKINSLNNRAIELIKNNEKLEFEIMYHKKIEHSLRKNEERYRTLFLNNPIESIIVDQDGRITDYNHAKARTKGRVPAIGEIMYVDYGSRHMNDMFSELMDSIKTGRQKEFPEQKYNEKYLHIKISPFNCGAIITAIDITKRTLAECRIQTLTREILRVQENERKRIARDLHDSVAQDLSSLRISCETFFDDHTNNIFKIRYKVRDISKVLHGAIQALREIAYELRPPSLDELGLPITLYRYCEEFSSKIGIEVDFFSAGLEKGLIDPDTEINLYRIVQETLSNIKKHSQARLVSIRLVASYPNIILRIKDNGTGFEIGLQSCVSNRNKRMGLRSMEERVSLLGGKIEIQSNPGMGTAILVEVPGLKIENSEILSTVEKCSTKKTKISVAVN